MPHRSKEHKMLHGICKWRSLNSSLFSKTFVLAPPDSGAWTTSLKTSNQRSKASCQSGNHSPRLHKRCVRRTRHSTSHLNEMTKMSGALSLVNHTRWTYRRNRDLCLSVKRTLSARTSKTQTRQFKLTAKYERGRVRSQWASTLLRRFALELSNRYSIVPIG